jgi:D-glycero-alpha-D-manno-heptose 1-phosphate guanylyltransferase
MQDDFMPAMATRPPRRLADIPAVVLAGGLGTRLRSAVAELPKVLAPVHERPFLAYLLDRLAAASLRRVVLLTGYRADDVEQTFGAHFGPLVLEYSRETTPLGTGGAIRKALDRLDSETILLLNGDSCCGVELPVFFARHRWQAADISMVVTRVDDLSRYGEVRLDSEARIVGYAEKPATVGPGWINAGIYLLQRPILEELPANEPSSLERGWLQRWTSTRKVMAFPSAGPFLDIGTPESYGLAEAFFLQRETNPVRTDLASRRA